MSATKNVADAMDKCAQDADAPTTSVINLTTQQQAIALALLIRFGFRYIQLGKTKPSLVAGPGAESMFISAMQLSATVGQKGWLLKLADQLEEENEDFLGRILPAMAEILMAGITADGDLS